MKTMPIINLQDNDKMTITICPKLFTFWEKVIWTWRIWTGYKKDLDILAKVKVDRK